MAQLRHDPAHPRPARRSRPHAPGPTGKVDVESGGPLSGSMPQQSPDLPSPTDPGRSRKPLVLRLRHGSQAGFLDPGRTTRDRRPRRRRRLSVARPPLVRMRARKPCLFKRLRFRGLYVGFIFGLPGLKSLGSLRRRNVRRDALELTQTFETTGPARRQSTLTRHCPSTPMVDPSHPANQPAIDFLAPGG